MKSILLVSLSIFLTFFALAQKPIQVTAISKTMSKGVKPGLAVMIHETEDLKGITSDWGKLIKGKSKAKAQVVGEELVILGTQVTLIANDSLNIYTTFTPSKHGILLNVWFETKEGFVSSKNQNYYLPAQKLMHDFAAEHYREVVEEQIKEEQKVLKNLEKELDKLAKEHDKLLGTISGNRVEIEGIKNDIAVNEADQERVRGQIQAQKKNVIQAKSISEEAGKSAEKELKSLEKQLDKLVKEHQNYHKKINDLESEIRDAERDVIDNESDREAQLDKIKEQKGVIVALEKKLENIK